MMTPETRLVRAEGVLAGEIDGDLVMMDVASGTYIALDSVGADIWRRLEAPISLGALCEALGEDYEADADTILGDVRVFVEKMRGLSLIATVD